MNALETHLHRQLERSRRFFWHRLRWRLVTEYVPPHQTGELVDVGAGAGLLGDFLRAARPRIHYRFVEPIASLERDLEQRFGRGANARVEATFAGADWVTLLDVLEHQEDDRAFLSELAGRLRPGATLVVTVPALPSLWSQWDDVLGHHRRYDASRLRAAVAGLPLAVREVSYLFPELVPLGYLRKLTRRGGARGEAEVEFPALARPVNELLYALGTASLRTRRIVPFGSSLVGVFTRR